MSKLLSRLIILLVGIGVVLSIVFDQQEYSASYDVNEVTPDWAAIAAWPNLEANEVEARPDPNRAFTAIILDDSGSMGGDIDAAKAAVIAALEAMAPEDRVAVIALNAGQILPFTQVAEAAAPLTTALARVRSDGTTPLSDAVKAARLALASEAMVAGAFGTYRMLVTTDGVADDPGALQTEIEDIARTTPIQIATIGVGITGGHILRRDDLGAFVAIDDVSQLEAALRDAIAEEQTFSAITNFGGN